MKKSLSFLLAVVMMISSFSVGLTTAFAADVLNAEIEVTYQQTEARSMLSLINNFRKSSDAWYWKENNKDKVTCRGLSNLVYDYDLEKIAMQRAAEVAVKFSHIRPNGESWYSAYPYRVYMPCGENIAAGYVDAQDVFIGWREDNENYDGQGHRRNMLSSDYAAVGIACAEYGGVKYWVQEFGSPAKNVTPTAANNAKTGVEFDVNTSDMKNVNITVDVKNIDIKTGESADLPIVSVDFMMEDIRPVKTVINSSVTPEWTVEDNSVVQIFDGKIVALKEGQTTVTATVMGKKISIPITVTISENECSHTSVKWVGDGKIVAKQCQKCGRILVTLPFDDLGNFVYYGDFVEYTSVSNKFITGTNPPERTLFSPTMPITRAMFVTILYRMAGEPYKNANPYPSTPFTDITDTSVYYYDAACWALKNGITTETTFKPFDNVSREQTASFLFRYAKDNGKLGDSAYKNVNLADYPDYNSVHGWAVEAMQWANYNGMITGTQQGYINPQGATQRIHATKILYGFGKTCNIGNFG